MASEAPIVLKQDLYRDGCRPLVLNPQQPHPKEKACQESYKPHRGGLSQQKMSHPSGERWPAEDASSVVAGVPAARPPLFHLEKSLLCIDSQLSTQRVRGSRKGTTERQLSARQELPPLPRQPPKSIAIVCDAIVPGHWRWGEARRRGWRGRRVGQSSPKEPVGDAGCGHVAEEHPTEAGVGGRYAVSPVS